MAAALGLILLAVLLGPVLIKPVERNIEVFFLGAGTLAAALSGQLNLTLLHAAATAPLALAAAVLVFGAITHLIRPLLDRGVKRLLALMSPRWVCFILILVLGLLSSVITAVIAALILVEAISMLNLERRSEIAIVVLACFAIGLGAALTPMGEPLATIAISALHEDFWYLARLLGPLVVSGIVIVALTALALPARPGDPLKVRRGDLGWSEVALRTARVYLFVAGLVALSRAVRPITDTYVSRLPEALLFWLNGVSAVVDNATLTAAEIGPALHPAQQRAALMSLLISGGMLIPGNIPNIVAAGRCGIGSREWARVGMVSGLALMALCFVALQWID